ncbi:hypothetical protein EVAR_41201_1 [Eumeta japonica]|uniref:Uncharacterized protein n=1 Tax=Eumeta variegata TaxID=151549 RepID=A0A4C1WTE4_EUMVA|nr:hypothetical protein EVAR_41201_1 [Eumeta japonica]
MLQLRRQPYPLRVRPGSARYAGSRAHSRRRVTDTGSIRKPERYFSDFYFVASSSYASSSARSSRASYGDDAISYVQLKRDAHLCTVKCKMCPEHKVHAKLYGCTLIIDEEDDVIVSVVCEDCVASRALIEKVKEETIEQSKSNLWFELRYGRITASKAYEVSRCKTADGTLVSLILGGKIPETKHMKRGRVLEDQVRRTVEDMLKKLPSAVLY